MLLRYGLEILRIKKPEKQVEAAKEISERSKPDYQSWQIRNVEPLSWKEKGKKIRSFEYTLTPMPEECKDYPKLGIESQRNFYR